MPADPAHLDLLDHREAAPTPERALSKSRYISGLQCTKLPWHQYNASNFLIVPSNLITTGGVRCVDPGGR